MAVSVALQPEAVNVEGGYFQVISCPGMPLLPTADLHPPSAPAGHASAHTEPCEVQVTIFVSSWVGAQSVRRRTASLVPKRLDWVKAGRTPGGKEAEDHSHSNGERRRDH